MSYLLLLFGVFCGSTAILWIKASTLAPAFIAAGRLWLGALLLYPVFRHAVKSHPELDLHATLKRAVWPGLFMGAHMISWTTGARLTSSVDATLIVNLAPIALPFLLYFLADERVTVTEVVGTLIAVAGVAVLTVGELKAASDHWIGNITCFGSMIVAAAYMALGRKNRDIPSVWLYMVPLYAVSALVCLAWGLIFDGLPRTLSTPDLHAIIGLALVPTICGHTILNYSMKKLSGQVVAVFNVFQFVYAGALAAFLLKEYPKPIFYVSCVLIVAGSLVALRGKPPLPRAEEFTD